MSEKKKYRFNIIDVIIILVAVSCVVGGAVRYSLPSKLGIVFGGKSEAIVTFYMENVRTNVTKNSMVEGDRFYSKNYKCYLGELYNVSEFKYEPYVVYRANEDGIPTRSEVAHLSNVTGYIKIKGTVNPERGFMLTNTENISPGEKWEIYSNNRRMTVLILSVDIID